MKLSIKSIVTPLLLLLLSIGIAAQTTSSLPRSLPELQGVSSEGISQFLDAAGKSKHELHSFMFLRHGNVIAEAWWSPYRSDLKHTLYSTSKSFTATAIGFAVAEKRLTVEDKVITFFPGELPDSISTNLAMLRIRDLLSMSAGQEPEPTPAVVSQQDNWVKGFLAAPIVHEPGTKFLYNSLCTYMLSAIIQKVTGQKVIDYLTPRLFNPLGITGMDWESDPKGINTGGWGLRLKTEDLAKFGQLFLQKGNWNGTQVLPAAWVEEASSLKIVQNPDWSQAKRDSSDWQQGYCYQMWRCRHNAYRGDGAFGQFVIVMPEQDAVVIITSETSDMQGEINLVWQYLLPAMQADKLPANPAMATKLQQQLATLALPIPAKNPDSRIIPEIAGKTYTMAANEKDIQNMSFQFKRGMCRLTMKVNTELYRIAFDSGKWVYGQTYKLGPSLVLRAKGHFAGLPASEVAGSFRWKDKHTLELTLRYIDSPHTETFTCHFDKKALSVDIQNSFEKSKPVTITGTLSN